MDKHRIRRPQATTGRLAVRSQQFGKAGIGTSSGVCPPHPLSLGTTSSVPPPTAAPAGNDALPPTTISPTSAKPVCDTTLCLHRPPPATGSQGDARSNAWIPHIGRTRIVLAGNVDVLIICFKFPPGAVPSCLPRLAVTVRFLSEPAASAAVCAFLLLSAYLPPRDIHYCRLPLLFVCWLPTN